MSVTRIVLISAGVGLLLVVAGYALRREWTLAAGALVLVLIVGSWASLKQEAAKVELEDNVEAAAEGWVWSVLKRIGHYFVTPSDRNRPH